MSSYKNTKRGAQQQKYVISSKVKELCKLSSIEGYVLQLTANTLLIGTRRIIDFSFHLQDIEGEK